MEKTLSLFLIYQNENNDYDTYDSAIVVAYTIDEARDINPKGKKKTIRETIKTHDYAWGTPLNYWAEYEHIHAEYIGIADITLKHRAVVCASFNAG